MYHANFFTISIGHIVIGMAQSLPDAVYAHLATIEFYAGKLNLTKSPHQRNIEKMVASLLRGTTQSGIGKFASKAPNLPLGTGFITTLSLCPHRVLQ